MVSRLQEMVWDNVSIDLVGHTLAHVASVLLKCPNLVHVHVMVTLCVCVQF